MKLTGHGQPRYPPCKGGPKPLRGKSPVNRAPHHRRSEGAQAPWARSPEKLYFSQRCDGLVAETNMAGAANQTIQVQGWLDRLRAGDESARKELLNCACDRLTRLTRKMLKSYPR